MITGAKKITRLSLTPYSTFRIGEFNAIFNPIKLSTEFEST